MSHFFFWRLIKFCPKCGVQSLLRDMDKQGHHNVGERQLDGGTEWWCTTCGFSFKIAKSRKWYIADELQRRDRQQRTGKPSDNTEPEVLDAFVEFLEEGKLQ
jgi:hypothetical protein